MASPAFVRQHPAVAYFALTFVISWGGVVGVIGGPAGFTGSMAQDNPLFLFAVLAMVAGPCAAGILLTRLLDGRAGLLRLRQRLTAGRVSAWGYAVALLTAPLLAAGVALTLSAFSPEFIPRAFVSDNAGAVLLLGTVVALIAGTFEELGWTGFAIPRLRRRYSVIATGLVVGLLWSGWHLLVTVWGIGDRGGSVSLPLFIAVDSVLVLPAFRVLMVWVYDRTRSLPLAILMHASLTATTLVLWPGAKGLLLLTFDAALAAAIWVVVAMLFMCEHRHLDRRSARAPVAA